MPGADDWGGADRLARPVAVDCVGAIVIDGYATNPRKSSGPQTRGFSRSKTPPRRDDSIKTNSFYARRAGTRGVGPVAGDDTIEVKYNRFYSSIFGPSSAGSSGARRPFTPPIISGVCRGRGLVVE